MRKIFLSLIVSVFALSSCTSRITDFTIISTKNYPITAKEAKATPVIKANQRVKGTDKSHIVLFVPTGSPNMKEAIDRAIESYPGAVGLADGVLKQKVWYIPGIYGQSSYIVEGTPLYPADENFNNISTNNRRYSDTNRNSNRHEIPETHDLETTLIFYHEVKNDESLYGIAKQYDVSIRDILKWNHLSSDELVKGTKLKILITE